MPVLPESDPSHADVHAGLPADLPRLLQQAAGRATDRRGALRWLGMALSLGVPLSGCGGGGDAASDGTASSGDTTGGSTTTGGTSTGTSATCSVINEETAGPYPGDGSNTSGGAVANALALSGIVRRDIRASIAGATGVAAGVPLQVRIVLVDAGRSCAALADHAIYLWHCDAQGRYSMYSAGVTAENYLRGVQPTDASGTAVFDTIYPGCYAGRMPHIHFEVYRSAAAATSFANRVRTSQIALPNEVSSSVYALDGYGGSAANLSRVSFASDGVFSDGVTLQLASVGGSIAEGFVATLQVGIAG